MRLSTKGRLALAAMIDVAMRQHRGPVTLAGVSQRQRISLSYLEQLFARLRRHQLVRSARGPGGGYTLAKPAETITVADVIFAVDEAVSASSVPVKANGEGGQACSMQDLWVSLDRQIVDFLDAVTLKDLLIQQRTGTAPSIASPRLDAPQTQHEIDVEV